MPKNVLLAMVVISLVLSAAALLVSFSAVFAVKVALEPPIGSYQWAVDEAGAIVPPAEWQE